MALIMRIVCWITAHFNKFELQSSSRQRRNSQCFSGRILILKIDERSTYRPTLLCWIRLRTGSLFSWYADGWNVSRFNDIFWHNGVEEKQEGPPIGGAVRNATSFIPQRLSSIILSIACSENVHPWPCMDSRGRDDRNNNTSPAIYVTDQKISNDLLKQKWSPWTTV